MLCRFRFLHRAVALIFCASCVLSTAANAATTIHPAIGYTETGIASFYNAPQGGMTMAHRGWAIGTKVLVTNIKNGRKLCLSVADHGPYHKGRIADLSITAARRIGLTHKQGITRVRLKVVTACSAK